MMQRNHTTNTLKLLGVLSVFLLVNFPSNGQQLADQSKGLVIYDPLLWKHELKLNANQREKIQQINLEFYQSIYNAAKDGGQDRATLQLKANQYIEQRSQEIWDAFNP